MGYYTKYNLRISGAKDGTTVCPTCKWGQLAVTASQLRSTVIDKIVELARFSPFEDDCKWYDHEENMRMTSLEFPELTLILSGQGEEQGDVWVKEFHAGKMRVAKKTLVQQAFTDWA